MAAADEQRGVMAPIFVKLIERLSRQEITALCDADRMALIPAIHLLAEWRDKRAYRPFLNLLRRPTHTLDCLLGDSMTETGFRVIAGTFDGDLSPVFAGVLDTRADIYARSTMMSALVLIAHLNPELRPAIEGFIRCFRENQPTAPTDLLIGWMETVADLDLVDMSDEVRALFDHGLIPQSYCDFSAFLGDLQATQEANGNLGNKRYRQGLISDSIAELSEWHCYSDAYFEPQRAI